MAVAAPYENDLGAIYIFMGSKNGIIKTPSQKIYPPSTQLPITFSPLQMFGVGLSRGVDIDANGFNDFAVGAPNIDTVYVFKSYPSIDIISEISSYTPQIDINTTSTRIQICMAYFTVQQLNFDVATLFTIKLDPQVKRAQFSDDGQIEKTISVNLTPDNQCQDYTIQLKYNLGDVFVPIGLELHHKLVKKFENEKQYCDDCVAINPLEDHFVKNQIIFSTGCLNVRCVANLKLTGAAIEIPNNV